MLARSMYGRIQRQAREVDGGSMDDCLMFMGVHLLMPMQMLKLMCICIASVLALIPLRERNCAPNKRWWQLE